MRKLAILGAALALSACATTLNPNTCRDAANGLHTADELVALFVNLGGNPATARKLADAVVAGQMIQAAACAQIEHTVT